MQDPNSRDGDSASPTSTEAATLTEPVSSATDSTNPAATAQSAEDQAPSDRAETREGNDSSGGSETLGAASSEPAAPATDSATAPPQTAAASELAVELPLPTFEELGVSPSLRAAIDKIGWAMPTRVQAAAYAPLSSGKDLMVQSRTGSGKTGAFCLPWLATRYDPAPAKETGVQLLVLLPTRELAKQVCEELVRLADGSGIRPLPVYGGTAMQPQLDALAQGVHAVVGTPGRILDHLRRRSLNLSKVRCVVLDECDEMLSMGFLEDIRAILEACPVERQTCLFSATLPPDIARIAKRYMRNPERIELSNDGISATEIQHRYYSLSGLNLRPRDLLDVIMVEDPASAIIFCNTREDTRVVATTLQRAGYEAEALSSDLTQSAREHVMGLMREQKLRFLVATDIAARGIDISHVSHVFNFALPESSEVYVHRTGRTGRAGRRGVAISLLRPQDIGNFYQLTKLYSSIRFEERTLPPDSELNQARLQHRLDAISQRSELVSPEWMVLTRALLQDPRADRVLAWLLAEHASAERLKNRPPAANWDNDRSSDDSAGAREGRYDNERRDGFGGRGRDRDRHGGGRRDRDGGRDRPRDGGRRFEGERGDRPRRDDRTGTAVTGAANEAPTAGETLTALDAGAATPREGEGRRTRDRSRREHAGSGDTHRVAPPSVRDPDARDEEEHEVLLEGAAADDDESDSDGEQDGVQADGTAGAGQTGGKKKRRRRRRKGGARPQGDAAGTVDGVSAESGAQDVAAAGDDTSQGLDASDEDGDEDGDEDDAASSQTDGATPGAGGGKRRRRRRRRKPGAGGGGAADQAENAAQGAHAGAQAAKPPRPPGPRPIAIPPPVIKKVSQDEILIDIDEGELDVVRGEFGEIDELDEFTLKGRRRGLLDDLQDEVVLEDLSGTDASRDDDDAGDEDDDAANGDGSEDAGDAADRRGSAVGSSDAVHADAGARPLQDDGSAGEAGSASSELDGADAADKRKRRRRKKKAAPPPPPKLTAPPHKDFWEVWAGATALTEFSDEQYPLPVEPPPPVRAAPQVVASQGPRAEQHHHDSPEPSSYVAAVLNLGRQHGLKSADVRVLLADRAGLTGRAVRDLTVRETDTLLRVDAARAQEAERSITGSRHGDTLVVFARLEQADADGGAAPTQASAVDGVDGVDGVHRDPPSSETTPAPTSSTGVLTPATTPASEDATPDAMKALPTTSTPTAAGAGEDPPAAEKSPPRASRSASARAAAVQAAGEAATVDGSTAPSKGTGARRSSAKTSSAGTRAGEGATTEEAASAPEDAVSAPASAPTEVSASSKSGAKDPSTPKTSAAKRAAASAEAAAAATTADDASANVAPVAADEPS